MPFTVILLVLISCVFHAGWNLQAKRREIGPAFFLTASVFILVPATPAFFALGGGEMMRDAPGAFWLCLLITGACQAAYFTFLAQAYRNGDVSLVYPVARTAPLFVVPLAGFIQNRWPAPLGLLGILLAVLGCFILPRRGLSLRAEPFSWAAYAGAGSLWALATAFASSGYTVADAIGVQMVSQSVPGIQGAFLYACLEWLTTALWLLLPVLALEGRERIRRSWQRTQWLHTFTLGAVIFGTYLLILWAYSMTDKVAYVAGMRQFSIVLGVLGGIRLLNEPRSATRLVGASVIVAGLVLIALSR